MIKVLMDEEDVIDMLVDRVKYWKEDEDIIELYRKYYDDLVYSGALENAELDVPAIVDNDCVNYTSVITRDEFEDYDIEDEDDDRILAQNGDLFLIGA